MHLDHGPVGMETAAGHRIGHGLDGTYLGHVFYRAATVADGKDARRGWQLGRAGDPGVEGGNALHKACLLELGE
jgi:hypothetical protein